MAAVLACGPGAALSHRSAAALWGLGRTPETIDVTARTDHRVNGVRVHRSRTLTPGDVTHHYGIPVTTPQRTLRDLRRVLDSTSLTRAVNDARLAHLIKDTRTPTRSVLEDAFLAFLDRHGLPKPEVNQIVAGYEVDMLWREQRLIAELDGRAFHQDFEADRDRDADLLTVGFRVVRVTHRRLERDELREAQRFAVLLGLSGGGGIRTLGAGVTHTTVFETARFNHSRTPPG